MSERILLIGSGGREHALARALRSSPTCDLLFCAPGNPGIAQEAVLVNLDITEHESVVEFVSENNITLIVIGPEQPLADGLADSLRLAGCDVFGPSADAARLESSKGFSKDFMLRHGIPTATYARFDRSQIDHALNYVSHHDLPVVIKYDGLAAGKGVVVAETVQHAQQTVHAMFDGAFGSDGIVVEGFLKGQEASVFAITDGTDYIVLAPSQDHKRIGDGDTGKNTGGMGAYAPAPIVTDGMIENVKKCIIEPTLEGLRSEGTPFIGCLYCGLMIDGDDVNVVEFNARFGDPETQVVMNLIDGDVVQLFAAAARGTIATCKHSIAADRCAVCVVIASEGYPDDYAKGKPLTIPDMPEHTIVYHAGTKLVDGVLVTSGGRVLGVTSTGNTLKEARDRAYEACAKISFEGMYYRRDIADKALRAINVESDT